MIKALFLVSFLWLTAGFTYKNDQGVKNYYNIPEILTFDGVQYKLVASYHPEDSYYKQEYIPAGESADHFYQMLFIDLALRDATPAEMLELKAKEMQDRKNNDPVVNYEILENNAKGEYILDFILSDSKDGKLSVVERNVYRYKYYTVKGGHGGVLLFAFCQRGYDKSITAFFHSLKDSREGDINKVGIYSIPEIEIK